MRRSKLLALLALALAVSHSCGGGSELTEADLSPEVKAFLQRVGDDLPEAQRDALSDGVVTFAEYEAAYSHTVSCLRGEGLKVEGPTTVNRGRFLSYSVAGGTGDADAACRAEHLEYTDELWNLQAVPTETEMESIALEYATCLEAAGISTEPGASLQEVDFAAAGALGGPHSDAVLACAELYSLGIFVEGAQD